MWSLVVAILTLAVGTIVSIALYGLGRRLDFRSRMRRWDELRAAIDELTLGRDDLRDVILMNARRYEKDYNGGNDTNRYGSIMGKGELLGTRHNGAEVVCAVVETWIDPSGKRTFKKSGKRGENALQVGFVPFDYIEHINPSGDEYRAEPIFYVRYKGPGRSPYASYTYVGGPGRQIDPSGRLHFDPIYELGERRVGRLRGWLKFTAGRIRGAKLERRIKKMYSGRL